MHVRIEVAVITSRCHVYYMMQKWPGTDHYIRPTHIYFPWKAFILWKYFSYFNKKQVLRVLMFHLYWRTSTGLAMHRLPPYSVAAIFVATEYPFTLISVYRKSLVAFFMSTPVPAFFIFDKFAFNPFEGVQNFVDTLGVFSSQRQKLTESFFFH